jgi:hypothetical protein
MKTKGNFSEGAKITKDNQVLTNHKYSSFYTKLDILANNF